jgi:hypothetical protein
MLGMQCLELACAYCSSMTRAVAFNTPTTLLLPAGNRPSMSIMLPSCTAYTVGQILALYEHRVAVQVGGWMPGWSFSLFVQHKTSTALLEQHVEQSSCS